jgi:hypothetical protein
MKKLLFIGVLILGIMTAQSQEFKIKGVVTDESNLPLPSATVIIKGTTIGTSTDFDGFFELDVTMGDILVFNYVGYTSKEVTVKSKSDINVKLDENSTLDEAVVTAMSIKRSTSSVSESLKGKASGLVVSDHSSSRSRKESLAYITSQTPHSQLTAGEINDLQKWNEWQDLLKEQQFFNLKTKWGFGLTNKIDVKVLDSLKKPVSNVLVKLYNDDLKLVMSARTDINGNTVLFKDLFEAAHNSCYTIQMIENGRVIGKRLLDNENKINFISTSQKNENAVDIMFTIDATGSMGDEINYLKAELANIIKRVGASIQQKRLALTFYRDFGDAYVTKSFNFSEDISKIQNDLMGQNANGGGDYEEAVEEALKISLEQDWNIDSKAKLLFLLLDAPPHFTQENVALIKKQIQLAQEKGIKIIPIVASGANKDVEFLMRFFSVSTNGTYVFLTDDSGIGNTHLKASTKSYKVEKLNDLILRLIEAYSLETV